jgi:hypothetical protein
MKIVDIKKPQSAQEYLLANHISIEPHTLASQSIFTKLT